MTRPAADLTRIYLRPGPNAPSAGRPEPVSKVEVGQIFRKTDAFHSLWQVTASFADGSGVRHARLCNKFDRTTVKLIAEAALRNPRFYIRVASEEPRPSAEKH
ncbi:MAG TPA: hypothetical protein VMF53_04310 [Alphaproteobacteria bacterium]|nr:hypothetical protein [Alphaproteobacteria bacterium]